MSRIWIVSYADASFRTSEERLMASAARYGIDVRRRWDREALERTLFYRQHRDVLDAPRGGGYWLWKPFIIEQALMEMPPGDLLMYADAGIEVAADLGPLFELCRTRTDILLFAGHYEDVKAPGPNLNQKFTKRDCFVFMDCDQPRYHQAQMVDASVIMLANTRRVRAFVREWFLRCREPALLTDAPNVCGLPDLPGFIAHRHDQSILSLLAVREGLELFRHPSQHGNHVKEERYRAPGEWTRHPYGSKGLFTNSPYGTLLHHHRGFLGQTDLRVSVRRVVPAPRPLVFQAWTSADVLERWAPPDYAVVKAEADVRVGGTYRLLLSDAGVRDARPTAEVRGTYVDVRPPALLVYGAPLDTQVSVAFHEEGAATTVALEHGTFKSERVRERWSRLWNGFLDHLVAELTPPAGVPRSLPPH